MYKKSKMSVIQGTRNTLTIAWEFFCIISSHGKVLIKKDMLFTQKCFEITMGLIKFLRIHYLLHAWNQMRIYSIINRQYYGLYLLIVTINKNLIIIKLSQTSCLSHVVLRRPLNSSLLWVCIYSPFIIL